MYREINPTVVGRLTDLREWKSPLQRAWVEETVLLPFEKLMLPCPKNYEEVLVARFGDWHKFVVDCNGYGHGGVVTSPDIPYAEYLAKIDKSMLPKYEKALPKYLTNINS